MSSIMNSNEQPLPYGWTREFDHSGHPFYVDTKATPPRSIWVHPYEDPQFLHEHPDVREKVGHGQQQFAAPDGPPPGHSGTSRFSPPKGKRGILGKLKDKAIGTKEERAAEKQRIEMLQQQRRQQYAAARFAPQQHYGYHQQPMGGGMMGGGMGGRRRGGGMGGMALPLAGGLAGGLILGAALDNDDYGGDCGDFDGGGDFGGD